MNYEKKKKEKVCRLVDIWQFRRSTLDLWLGTHLRFSIYSAIDSQEQGNTLRVLVLRVPGDRTQGRISKHPDSRSYPPLSDGVDPPTPPSGNTAEHFQKSLKIGVPVSRTETKRNRSCASMSDEVDPLTFYTLCKLLCVFLKSLAIGLPISRTDTKKDGQCLSVPDCTLYSL